MRANNAPNVIGLAFIITHPALAEESFQDIPCMIATICRPVQAARRALTSSHRWKAIARNTSFILRFREHLQIAHSRLRRIRDYGVRWKTKGLRAQTRLPPTLYHIAGKRCRGNYTVDPESKIPTAKIRILALQGRIEPKKSSRFCAPKVAKAAIPEFKSAEKYSLCIW